MSEHVTIRLNESDIERLEETGKPIDELNERLYLFDEADFVGFAGKIRGAGSDRLELVFTGYGPALFLATFASGEPAQKPVAGPWAIDVMRFAPAGTVFETEEMGLGGLVGDLLGDVLTIRERDIHARVTVTSTSGLGDEQRPVCQIKMELSVRRAGNGLVRDLTGDPVEDREILDPDLLLAIGRMVGRSGTLFMLRSAESAQGEMFAAQWEPPDGTKERSLRRGSKKAVKILDSIVSAERADGTSIEVQEALDHYTRDNALHLRTWDGGPVKVLKDFTLLYVLQVKNEAPGGQIEVEE